MTDSQTEPAPDSSADAEIAHQLTCAACRVIDRADGVEDGHLWNPAHYTTKSSRDLFALMRRVQDHTADGITAFVHIGETLGLDVEHVEDVVRRAIDGALAAMRNAPTTPAKKSPAKSRT